MAWAPLPGFVFPPLGIVYSTGAAWSSSYSTSGAGSAIALADSPVITTLLTATGSLQLTGNATATQNIGTSQTTGILNVGGSLATGGLNIGTSTRSNTINIGSAATGTGQTRTILIGTSALTTGITNLTMGRYSATVAHTTTISGRDVTILAQNLTLSNIGALKIGQNLAQVTLNCIDLTVLVGVVQGSRAFVLDNAVAPVFYAIVVDGGGAGFPTPVFYDGTNWRCG